MRVFSTRKKNCYSIKVDEDGGRVLLRASFYYGNYDGKDSPPVFDLQFDGNFWTTVNTSFSSYDVLSYETIYVVKRNFTSTCVAQTKPGQLPFISAIEVRSLGVNMYSQIPSNLALHLIQRAAFGGNQTIIRTTQSKFTLRHWIVTNLIFVRLAANHVDARHQELMLELRTNNDPPETVLKNAVVSLSTSEIIVLLTDLSEKPTPIYIAPDFSEVLLLLNTTQKRSFQLCVDNKPISDPIIPLFGSASEAYVTNRIAFASNSFSIQATTASTLPPLLNAMEIYTGCDRLTNGTNVNDVEGLAVVQSGLKVLQEWRGDPCLPSPYTWDWVQCSSDPIPRVTALNLSGYGLSGSLPDFSSMDALQTIDLSNNSFSRNIPDFRGTLPTLNIIHKFQSKRDETLLLQTDLSKANTVIPKPIQWKDVNLPEEWILEGIAPPAVPKQLEPNTELQNVTQYSDESSPITIRKKIPEWKLTDSNKTIESEHPPFRSITIDHGEPPIEIRASPYKIPKPNDSEANLSSIIQYNNFCNTNLNTIGKQLTRIENQFQKSTITVSSISPIPSKSDSDKKIKEPIFKPFQIAPDTPQSSKIGVLNLDQVSIASSDLEAFTEEPVPEANKIHWELALPTSKSPPDLTIDNRPNALNQSRYNASSVYEWNIDGMSEYNILGVLQQMTMAANAYKTQSGTSDKAIAEILIAGFTGQLKGWWDHLLTKLQQLDIFNAIQTDENGAPILDEFNNPIQDAVATLILTISLHFIGDPSHLRDKNAELLHNLRMNKRLQELDLNEEILSKIAPLLAESSDSESSMSGDSDPLQVDELFESDTSASSSSDSDSDSYLKKINVLTKDQEIFLELVKHISDPNLQKEFLDKLLKTMDSNKAETSKVPIVKKNSYDLTEILDKKKTKKSTPSIQDLQKEIKDIKLEIKDLKEKQKSDSNTIQLLLQKQLQDNSDNESTPDDDDQKVENIKAPFPGTGSGTVYAPKPLDVCVARLAKEPNNYLVIIWTSAARFRRERAIFFPKSIKLLHIHWFHLNNFTITTFKIATRTASPGSHRGRLRNHHFSTGATALVKDQTVFGFRNFAISINCGFI
ncbi:protein kinase domain-containing protein [Citrus sinensis]|uniref:Protein kinase domain-containing protein n=1 Tax=Citrus sinensis TaxID=2711 RepID=A0ACB8M566_CITSI|nr:protein kinase domain-containing protein [Citrus sinensis]